MASVSDFLPPPDDAVILPMPMLAMDLLRFFQAANGDAARNRRRRS